MPSRQCWGRCSSMAGSPPPRPPSGACIPRSWRIWTPPRWARTRKPGSRNCFRRGVSPCRATPWWPPGARPTSSSSGSSARFRNSRCAPWARAPAGARPNRRRPAMPSKSRPPANRTGARHRAGLVAIVGRPNVGKSTLLNRLVGQKISITSRRPQTTRHHIIGIRTEPGAQLVFVDTPGFQTHHLNALNRTLNRAVTRTLKEVDAVVFMVEALRYGPEDRQVLRLLPREVPALLAVNKVDLVKDKPRLLPFIEQLAAEHPFAEIFPVSAEKGDQVEALAAALRGHLPEGPPLYGPHEVTDRSERFLAGELIREKLFRLLGEEIPYATGVVVEKFEEEGKLRRIAASIIVDKPAQKAIVIGREGEKLKAVASSARQDMERLFGGKVFLEVWVKVRSGWADDARALKALGYE